MLPLLVAVLSAEPITFQAARAAAEKVAPELRIAEKNLEVAAAGVHVARTLDNPTLTVTSAKETAHLATAISVPIPAFGQVSKNVDAAEADRVKVGFDVEVVRVDARWNATIAWIDLWEAQQRSVHLRAGAEDAEKLAAVAQERFDAGSGPRFDVVRAKVDRARALAESRAQETTVRSAAAKLSALIGMEDRELTAAGDPEFAASLGALASYEQSLEQHPTLVRDRAQEDAAAAHVAAEERQRWPIINLEAEVDAFDPDLMATDLIFGLSFDLPVFNQRGGAIERAEAERSVAEATLEIDRRKLRAELREAYQKAQGAEIRAVALDREVLPLIDEARQMTEEGYRDGRVDLLRVLEAAHTLIEVRIEHAEASAARHRAYADLERSLGRAMNEAPHAP